MSGYQYSTPFNGTLQSLPYDFLRYATEPGRNIAAGMESLGKIVGDGIGAFLARKDQNSFVDQHLQDLLGEIHSETSSGNIMDRKTPESKLLSGVMHMTKTDSPDAFMEFVGKVPSMPLEKKKALASDLQFMLDRHDKNKMQESEMAYRNAMTQNLLNEMADRKAMAQSENDILSQPTSRDVMSEVPIYKNAFLPDIEGIVQKNIGERNAAQFWLNRAKLNAVPALDEAVALKDQYKKIMDASSGVGPEGARTDYLNPHGLDPDGKVLDALNNQISTAEKILKAPPLQPQFGPGMVPVQGPSRVQTGTQTVTTGKEPISYYEQFVNAAKAMSSRGIKVDANAVNAMLAGKGSNPPLPDGMVPMSTSQTVGNTTTVSENVPVKMAEMQAKMAPQMAERSVHINPELGGGVALAPSSKSAEELRDVGKQLSNGIEALTQLERFTKENGHSINPSTRAKVDPYYNQLISTLRSAWVGPGAVSDKERALMEKAIRNPNAFFSLDSSTLENLKTIKDIMIRGYKGQLESNGIQMKDPNKIDYSGDPRLK